MHTEPSGKPETPARRSAPITGIVNFAGVSTNARVDAINAHDLAI
jgi:hypothetical protein